MSVNNRNHFKTKWVSGYKPTQNDYTDLFDSYLNIIDNPISNGSESILITYADLRLLSDASSLVIGNRYTITDRERNISSITPSEDMGLITVTAKSTSEFYYDAEKIQYVPKHYSPTTDSGVIWLGMHTNIVRFILDSDIGAGNSTISTYVTSDNGGTGEVLFYDNLDSGTIYIRRVSGVWSGTSNITSNETSIMANVITIIDAIEGNAGSVIIHGGKAWQVNGFGSAGFQQIDDITLDNAWWYKKSSINDTDFYRPLLMKIKYDFLNDWVDSQTDAYNNTVGISLSEITNQGIPVSINPVDYTDWGQFDETQYYDITGNISKLGIYNNYNNNTINTNILTIRNNICYGAISNNISIEISNNTIPNLNNLTSNICDVISHNYAWGGINTNYGLYLHENESHLQISQNLFYEIAHNNCVGGIIQNTTSNLTGNIVSANIANNNITNITNNKCIGIFGNTYLNSNVSNISDNIIVGGNIFNNTSNGIYRNICNNSIGNNVCQEINNNSNNGSILQNNVETNIGYNSNDGSITSNVVDVISQNSNKGHISQNTIVTRSGGTGTPTYSVIENNTNIGSISLNSISGTITSNSNLGYIENNTGNSIQFNSNTGIINDNTVDNNIEYNNNKGSINSNISDTIAYNSCNSISANTISILTHNKNIGDIVGNLGGGDITHNSNLGDISTNININLINFNTDITDSIISLPSDITTGYTSVVRNQYCNVNDINGDYYIYNKTNTDTIDITSIFGLQSNIIKTIHIDNIEVPGFDTPPNIVRVLSNGNILYAGGFTQINGITCQYIAIKTINNVVDTTFITNIGTTVAATVNDVAVATGIFYVAAGSVIYRFTNAGVLEYSATANSTIRTVAYAGAINSIYIGGNFTVINSVSKNYIMRLNMDLTNHASFAGMTSGFNGAVYSITVRNSSTLYVGGDFTTYNGTTVNYIVGISATGGISGGFAMGAGFDAKVIKLRWCNGSSNIIAFGDFTTYDSATTNGMLTSIDITGAMDATFDTEMSTAGNPTVLDFDVSDDGLHIIVCYEQLAGGWQGLGTDSEYSVILTPTGVFASYGVTPAADNIHKVYMHSFTDITGTTNYKVFMLGSFTEVSRGNSGTVSKLYHLSYQLLSASTWFDSNYTKLANIIATSPSIKLMTTNTTEVEIDVAYGSTIIGTSIFNSLRSPIDSTFSVSKINLLGELFCEITRAPQSGNYYITGFNL